jgi:hypothetical protein
MPRAAAVSKCAAIRPHLSDLKQFIAGTADVT